MRRELVIIYGPSDSGKTYIENKILELYNINKIPIKPLDKIFAAPMKINPKITKEKEIRIKEFGK